MLQLYIRATRVTRNAVQPTNWPCAVQGIEVQFENLHSRATRVAKQAVQPTKRQHTVRGIEAQLESLAWGHTQHSTHSTHACKGKVAHFD